jgi:hypothetical protein
MTTSPSSGLSPEAKEFVPFIQIPSSTTIPSVYSPEQLIYPLMKFPEIEFHIQPTQQFSNNRSQSSTNDNTSQIILLPTTGCYPNSQILYSSNDRSSTYYPIDYSEQSVMNYSLQQQPKSNRISSFRQSRGINHRNTHYDQQESNNRRHFYSTNTQRISRGSVSSRSIQQHDEQKQENFNYQNNENDYQINNDGNPFKLRPEDFPSLPINNQQSEKIPVISANTM